MGDDSFQMERSIAALYEAAIERLHSQIKTRSFATVYERAAWHHDIGKHEGVELPYQFCPRCEMEHPLGRFKEAQAKLLTAKALLERWVTPERDLSGDDMDRMRLHLDDETQAFLDAIASTDND